MPLKVQVGQPRIAVHQGQPIPITGGDGQIVRAIDEGCYCRGLRAVGAWSIHANDRIDLFR